MSYAEYARRNAEELKGRETVRILALETSCDETAAAVVGNGRKILSNVVFSQIDLHELYGGVVPEIASRAHMEACDRVVDQALREAGMALPDVDALAVTKGPGLVGALLTGVNCMKGLAFAAGKPLVGVNHIEGHVSANYLSPLFCVWWCPAGTATWWRFPITEPTAFWARRRTTPPVKLLTRRPGRWDCPIREDRGLTPWRKKGIRKLSSSRVRKRTGNMTTVSAA